MNASLKAGHLGVKGSAFVVIANELKATADQVSHGALRLNTVLDGIERSASDLKQLRVDGDPMQLTKLEPSILHAIQEIEAGNQQLDQLNESPYSRRRSIRGPDALALRPWSTAVSDKTAALPGAATRLQSVNATSGKSVLSRER